MNRTHYEPKTYLSASPTSGRKVKRAIERSVADLQVEMANLRGAPRSPVAIRKEIAAANLICELRRILIWLPLRVSAVLLKPSLSVVVPLHNRRADSVVEAVAK